MARVKRLTPQLLKRLVLEEKKKLEEVLETEEEDSLKVASKTEEVDADGFADSLEDPVEWAQVLKLKEAKLRKRLARVVETRKKIRKQILKKI